MGCCCQAEKKPLLSDNTNISRHGATASQTGSQHENEVFTVELNADNHIVTGNESDDSKRDENDGQHNMDDDMKQKDVYTEECCDVFNCEPLHRLINILKHYQSQQKDNEEEIYSYFNENKYAIINDYHHVLQKHLNEDNMSKPASIENFKQIYGIINSETNMNHLKCDINNCIIYIRNNRERAKDSNTKVSAGMDLLDAIHCFFIHSVDTGYRMVHEMKSNHDQNLYHDTELSELKRYLKSKRNKLKEVRNKERIQHNKFLTQMSNNEIDIKSGTGHNEENDKKNGDANYSFGLRFDYWHKGWGGFDFEKLKPKYTSLKEELISNTLYKINLNIFDTAYEKANYLLNTSNEIKSTKCKYNDEYYGYGIKLNSPLDIDNILAIIFYTDYDTLSYKLSQTFRRINNETKKDVLSKNLEFGHWTKCLIETVNAFGTTMDETEINVFYA